VRPWAAARQERERDSVRHEQQAARKELDAQAATLARAEGGIKPPSFDLDGNL
jgi:hypothetical protein